MTTKKEEVMATTDKNIRRIRVRSAFGECDFKFVPPENEKADKFQKGTENLVYFYWTQGNGLNLSVDPTLDSSTLLRLDGVGIPKRLLKSGGLRAGTTIKEFPKTFGTLTPKNPSSRVGRMFEVQEFALTSFLKAVVSLVESNDTQQKDKSGSTEPNIAGTSALLEKPNSIADISDPNTSDSTSQGYESDPVLRRVIELYAVERARNHYIKNGYKVTELGKPFDLLCIRNDDVIHVEVKGSRSKLNAVILTVNEVKDARIQSWRSDLFLVDGICIDLASEASPIAREGSARVLENWDPKEADLSPSRFSYSLPVLSEWMPVPFET